jgi:nucleoside-diphosphate-sugar epimerase
MLSHHRSEPALPRRVVVLGSRGFVGTALVALLKREGCSSLPVPRQEVDLCEPGAGDRLRSILEPGDSVVVAAALTPDRGRDVATLMKNLRMAECLAQALAEAPCDHLVYISSDAVYDGRESLISEDTAPSPTDLYSLMHMAREQMLGHAAKARGIPFGVLRPCAIFGAGDTHNSYGPNRFIRSALTERRIKVFGAGEEMRDHVYIDDVVAMIAALLRHRSSGVLNAATGCSVPFGDLARLIGERIGADVAIESVPRSGPVTHRHFDTTVQLRSFPHFKRTELEEALRRTTQGIQGHA